MPSRRQVIGALAGGLVATGARAQGPVDGWPARSVRVKA